MTVFKLTPKQAEAQTLLGGNAEHIMLLGGSRSGKTFLLCRSIAVRMLKAEGSRHLVARYRLAHAKASIWRDTWPKMLAVCFPGLAEASKPNKSDLIYTFPNKSEMWLGGLDDKERVDKVLGNEYATVYLNECSQISYSARETLLTRLAQKTDLKLREYLDCTPPPGPLPHPHRPLSHTHNPPPGPLPHPHRTSWG